MAADFIALNLEAVTTVEPETTWTTLDESKQLLVRVFKMLLSLRNLRRRLWQGRWARTAAAAAVGENHVIRSVRPQNAAFLCMSHTKAHTPTHSASHTVLVLLPMLWASVLLLHTHTAMAGPINGADGRPQHSCRARTDAQDRCLQAGAKATGPPCSCCGGCGKGSWAAVQRCFA